jgi:antitoxin (DNA-binding transcriptional repressor) of toxin-antitoxin stability system
MREAASERVKPSPSVARESGAWHSVALQSVGCGGHGRRPGRTRIQRTPVALRRTGCYAAHVAREISVRDLRNHTAQVVAALRAGERLALTVNRTPVADIVPHTADRSPWVPSATLRRIVEEAAADAELLNDLADIRNSLIDQP